MRLPDDVATKLRFNRVLIGEYLERAEWNMDEEYAQELSQELARIGHWQMLDRHRQVTPAVVDEVKCWLGWA